MKLLKSFGYAFKGLRSALQDEPNLRIHFIVMSLVVLLGFYLRVEIWEWCTLVLAGGLVIGAELINSAIESLTDLTTLEQIPLAGKVKDISAAAVLIAAIAAGTIGILIFGRYLSL